MATIITITGPSGSGKSTLEDILADGVFALPAVSFTTRDPRPGEKPGVDYHFRSRREVEELKAKRKLVEYTEHSGNLYGVTAEEIDRCCYPPYRVTLVCDPQGVKHVRKYAAKTGLQHIAIFCATPLDICRARVGSERPARLEFLNEVESKWSCIDPSGKIEYDEVVPVIDTKNKLFKNWLKRFRAEQTSRSQAKYVEYENGDWLMFSRTTNHDDAAKAFQMAMARSGVGFTSIKSAGFVDYRIDGVSCMSESLSIKSDPSAAYALNNGWGSK